MLSDKSFPNYSKLLWRRSCIFSSGFQRCSTQTEISLDSLNHFTILCNVDGEKPKFFAIFHCEMFFFELTDNYLMKFGTKWWAMTHLCFQRLNFCWLLLLYPIVMPSSVNNSHVYCGMSLLFCPWPNFFECISGIKFTVHLFLQNKIRLGRQNIKSHFYTVCQLNKGKKVIHSQIYFKFTKNSICRCMWYTCMSLCFKFPYVCCFLGV